MTIPALTAAQWQLVTDNRRLAAWVVQRWWSLLSVQDKEEAIAEAVLGLAAAARLYDPTRGATFASYATLRIRATLQDWQERRQRVREIQESSLPIADDYPLDRADPRQPLPEEQTHLRLTVEACRRCCKAREWRLLYLRYGVGLSCREIGRLLGVSPQAANERAKRLLAQLRERTEALASEV